MAFAFEKLLVYPKSVDFADAVCDLTEQFPARYNHLADQVNRASLSIASTIAEGNGRFTKPPSHGETRWYSPSKSCWSIKSRSTLLTKSAI
jgi:hypothetical protein